MQREYRLLLDRAKEGPVQVLDSDGSALAVEPWEEAMFNRAYRERLSQIGQFCAAFDRHRAEPAAAWAEMTPFPWISTLDSNELAEFAAEIQPLALSAASQGDLEELDGCMHAWKSTADTYRAPQILEAMRDEGAPGEVFPPSYYGYAETLDVPARSSITG